ncbi:hypothetical protein N7505_007241 [Penicillium chrysogenum]|uniref:Uncharacterized protein n=1 Tax=Penicillium chrysogenum TaxID=5076 RepID=A0ABQ8WE36_PENCH|nr:hypothetical protein N7505_007241 [Penicillium chrysogenum]
MCIECYATVLPALGWVLMTMYDNTMRRTRGIFPLIYDYIIPAAQGMLRGWLTVGSGYAQGVLRGWLTVGSGYAQGVLRGWLTVGSGYAQGVLRVNQ